jgi:trigger factor
VKSAVKSAEPTKVELIVTVESDDFKPVMRKTYSEIAGQITVPGFRKGRVPSRILDQRLGRDKILGQAVDDGLRAWLVKALIEQDIRPLGPPEIDVTEPPDPAVAEPGLVFSVTAEVAPPITVPDLGEVRIQTERASASDEDVEALLDDLRTRFASLKTVDRPAQEDDFVTIDLKAEVDGEEVDSVSGISYQVGQNDLVKGLDEALEGLSSGEVTTFNAPVKGGPNAGRDGLITVTLRAVRERELPPGDDAFAELASSVDTIDELRAELLVQATAMAGQRQIMLAEQALLDHLLTTLDFPAPSGVVAEQARGIAGSEPADTPQDDAAGEGDSTPSAAVTAEATKQVRTQLLLDAMVQQLAVKITPVEFAGFLEQLSMSYGMAPEIFVGAAEQAGELPHFRSELLRRKAVEVALRRAVVEDPDGVPIDVERLLPPEAPAEDETGADVPTGTGGQATAAGQARPAEGAIDEVAIDMDALMEAQSQAEDDTP